MLVDDPDVIPKKAREPQMFDFGMGFMHDQPCAVFHSGPERQKAQLDCSHGVFLTSGAARRHGWYTVCAKTKFQRWLLKKFFGVNVYEYDPKYMPEHEGEDGA